MPVKPTTAMYNSGKNPVNEWNSYHSSMTQPTGDRVYFGIPEAKAVPVPESRESEKAASIPVVSEMRQICMELAQGRG